MVYYRGFSLFRIFDPFTTLVGMINTIITKLVIFFVILFYAYFMVVVMMLKLDKGQNVVNHFQNVYFWMILGGVEGEHFEIKSSYFPIIFGSLYITIVLLNILIAFLSNVFSRLEDQQKVSALREKAYMILDFELAARLFKFVIRRTVHLQGLLDRPPKQSLFGSEAEKSEMVGQR